MDKSYIYSFIQTVLEDYTDWLCKKGYTDADVYAEEPKAVDWYIEELKKKEKKLK